MRRKSSFHKGVSSDYAFCEGHVEILYSTTERPQDIIQQLGSDPMFGWLFRALNIVIVAIV